MRIARATAADLPHLAPLRLALWPDSDMSEPMPDLVLIARAEADKPVAFAEVSIRHDYVNGCETSPCAFLEGIYVAETHRNRGIARAMLVEAQNWAKGHGLTEFASDAPLDNEASHAVHKALGFIETERVVCFHMPLAGATA